MRTIFLYLILVVAVNAQMLTRDDLQRQVTLYENTLSKSKSLNISALQTGRIWLHLGILYQHEGLYDKSGQAFENAIRSFRILPVSTLDLAAAIDALGTVYLQTGNVPEAEHAELKALKIREEAAQKPDLARSWYHLATLYLHQRRAAEARDYAARAVNELLSEPEASPDDKISALFALSLSLGLSHKYPEAIQSLQDALRLAKATYRPTDFPVGLGTFLVGYTYWKAGELAPAGELMREGTDIMGRQLGWWSPAYRSVMTQYARFLRDGHHKDAARRIEQNVERARPPSNPATMDIVGLF